MTCFEKYKQDHPNHSEESIYDGNCPMWFFEIEKPDYCDKCDDDCERCWNREIPGTIKDSGERRTFESGAVRDMQAGKGRMDLLPWAAIMEVSKHCEAGAMKYGEHNVDRGIPTHSLCDSAARHLAKYLDGWTDEPHLLAATWNLLWAIQMQLKHPECVDTPWVCKTFNPDDFIGEYEEEN
jgi:hypothetical protein